MRELKDKLVNKLIEQIIADANSGDTSVLAEILEKCDSQLLIHSLPEEEWKEFEVLLEVTPTKLQKRWIKQANKYLSFTEDGSNQAVLDAIGIIRDHEDQNATIDVALGDYENVFPLEKFEFTFTCESFLEEIGYK